MAINPDAIKRFLAYVEPPIEVKGVPANVLHARIERATGEPYRPITPPYPHQIEAVTLSLLRQRAMLFLEMRLGKTKCALDWAEHLRKCGEWRGKGLIIVPSPVLLHVWEHEAKIHSRLRVSIVRSTVAELGEALDDESDLVVIAWPTLQALFCVKQEVVKKTKDGHRTVSELTPDIDALEHAAKFFSLAILDELHLVKNHETLRYAIGERLLAHCDFRLGLTGTPIGRNAFDIWAQTYLIDDGKTLGRNFYFFKYAFGKQVFNRFARGQRTVVFDPAKLPILQSKLASISISYRLAECRELPEICRGTIELRMSPEQRRLYLETLDGVIQRKRLDRAEQENVFVKLRQISSGHMPYETDSGERHVHSFASAKIEWLTEFLDERPDGAKIIIFHEFTPSGERICALLTKLKIKHVWLYGGTKDRGAVLSAFCNGDASVLVANTATGGVGIDLQVADYQLFFESPVSPIVRAQAEARALGPKRGKRALLLDDFVASPVERKILEYVREGRDLLADLVFDDKAWKEFRT